MLCFNIGKHDIIRFSGPDAIRFLNGQLTQDARKVADDPGSAAFSCVTDPKGRLQFRVVITADEEGAILVAVPTGEGEALEGRLTRYLIADDAEADLLPASFQIHHLTGNPPPPPSTVMARKMNRFGEDGIDWWIPSGTCIERTAEFHTASIEEMEQLRISRGIPAWGFEITKGMLPPEAALETSDISYQKGCYIGQEVISRIKSAGKVNRILTCFSVTNPDAKPGPITDPSGKEIGAITSIAPSPTSGTTRPALGYVRRTADLNSLFLGHEELRVVRP